MYSNAVTRLTRLNSICVRPGSFTGELVPILSSRRMIIYRNATGLQVAIAADLAVRVVGLSAARPSRPSCYKPHLKASQACFAEPNLYHRAHGYKETPHPM